MTFKQLKQGVEDGPIVASLRLASTTLSLMMRMASDTDLQNFAVHNLEDYRELIHNAKTLFETSPESGYSHPGDLSLCAYLYLLAHMNWSSSENFITRVADSNRREFYQSIRVAKYLYKKIPQTTQSIQFSELGRGGYSEPRTTRQSICSEVIEFKSTGLTTINALTSNNVPATVLCRNTPLDWVRI